MIFISLIALVSTSAHNGFEGTIQRTHRPSYEDRSLFCSYCQISYTSVHQGMFLFPRGLHFIMGPICCFFIVSLIPCKH